MTPISLDFYGIEELLTDEERAARDRARRFVQEEVLSEIVPCHRAAKFPDNLIPRMGALGFYAPYLKGHGCAGLSHTAYGLIMQELERADSGFAVIGFSAGCARDTGDPFLWLTGATSTLATGIAFRQARRLFCPDGTRPRIRSRRDGNPRQARR